MNLMYGEVIDVSVENQMRFGRVRVGRAFKKIPLQLLTEVAPGDKVLVCDGVAISKVQRDADAENNNVPRDPR